MALHVGCRLSPATNVTDACPVKGLTGLPSGIWHPASCIVDFASCIVPDYDNDNGFEND
jgi:hypothetical protein